MVLCFTEATSLRFGTNLITEQAQVRYRALKASNWQLNFLGDREIDQYDVPETVYFLKRNSAGHPIGVCRLCRTDTVSLALDGSHVTCLLEDHFRHILYEGRHIPTGAAYRDCGRLCIDPAVSEAERNTAVSEIAVAIIQYCIDHDILEFRGVMAPRHWANVWEQRRIVPDWLGPEARSTENEKIRAATIRISSIDLDQVRDATGIHRNVLEIC